MTDPYRTCETRWFFAGEMPPVITEWFLTALPGDATDCPLLAREDLYLLTRGRGNAGLKFRRDKIQLKLCDDSLSFAVQGNRVAGVASNWARHSWSYDREAQDLIEAFSAAPSVGERVAVAKRRRQKAYDLGADGQPRALLRGEVPPMPLLIEITELYFADFVGWTLGLDAVGPSPAAHDRLLEAAEAILEDFPALPLIPGDSFSYPEFLGQQCLAPLSGD